MSSAENKPPILHILVVGFHHKLGCQVEFSYPPLVSGTSGRNECPSGWKYLPTLALPDGSHNFVEDTVFFNLPSLFEPTESIYGVSCYRQIPVEKLKIRTADVTRSTVQKSVCILARLPIYGYIEVKLSLIADAFFDQGDFSCTELLVKAYQQLNACLLDDETRRPLRHFHVGLSLREIVLHWRHKTLILFKLLLLQRRVVCFGSPVRGMCALILGISSLIPRLFEKGFQEVACVRTSRPLSPMPDFTDAIQQATTLGTAPSLQEEPNTKATPTGDASANGSAFATSEEQTIDESISESIGDGPGDADVGDASQLQTLTNSQSHESCMQRIDSTESGSASSISGATDSTYSKQRNVRSNSLTREASVDTLASTLALLCAVNPDEYRAPISIFASGNLCLPYLSLPYMDLLSDPSVLSYIIGTSNVLFQQKRQLADVLVDIEAANLETHDPELRRQLVLSTEDLRYMDYLLKHVQTPKEDAEGSEYWIREQFQGYILALLRTAVANDATAKDNDHFNAHFMCAFKRSQCFQEWYDVRPDAEFFDTLPAGHPFAGTLSVADMKLKIAQTMQNSESGRKLNQAVNTTSRAVGGAISQAKGAFSSWWSAITTPPTTAAAPPPADIDAMTSSDITTTASDGTTETVGNTHTDVVSVTFQNSKDNDGLDVGGVSIHLACSTSNADDVADDDDTRTDSAEELTEPSDSSSNANGVEHQPVAAAAPSTPTLSQGIVEIGREAELLDKKQQTAPAATLSCGGGDSSNAPSMEHQNGDVFIV